jgi:hypothetical protein
MHRRSLIIAGLAAAATPALAQDDIPPEYRTHPNNDPSAPPSPPAGANAPADTNAAGANPPADTNAPDSSAPADANTAATNAAGPGGPKAETYEQNELVNNVSDFLGVTAEAAGTAIERAFKDNGRPTGYIAGAEGAGAFFLGLRWGKGLLYMKHRPHMTVYWQGPSGGFDIGGNVSRVFTLCYDLEYPEAIFRRFPGVEGSAYFIGGLGVNYQKAEDITLAPIRAGVGLRLGASIGYLSYSREQHLIPL